MEAPIDQRTYEVVLRTAKAVLGLEGEKAARVRIEKCRKANRRAALQAWMTALGDFYDDAQSS